MTGRERKTVYRTIEEYAVYLKMAAIRRHFTEVIQEAELKSLSYEEFLLTLLQKEYDKRQQSGKESRIRIAEFPYKKYLEDLVVEDLPEDARQKFKTLSSLDFVKDGQNVILAGNPDLVT
jgi:DNA replication protein DnaC